MTCFSFRPLPLLRQGVLRFTFITAQLVSARASQTELEARAQIPQMRAAERCTDVTNEVVGASRWRGRANGASATT
jgi:hypothetical protein